MRDQTNRTILIIILFIWHSTGSVSLIGQEILSTEWELFKEAKIAQGHAEAWSVDTDQNDDVYWSVNRDDDKFLAFLNSEVFKLDDDSGEIWVTELEGNYAQQAYFLNVTDSIVYVGGRNCRSLGIENCDVLVFSLNASTGDTLWTFIWDRGFGYEEIDGIHPESDGIYLTGWSKGENSQMDVLLMKISLDGELIWSNTWGSPGGLDDHQDGHVVVDEDAIFVSGLFGGSPFLGYEGKALLAKFDKIDGTLIDSTTYGRTDPWINAENALGMTTDGTYLYCTGYTTTSANNWQTFIAKYDKDLNQIWYKTWGEDQAAEAARAIALSDDGSIYVGVNTESLGQGGSEVALLKLDSNGDLIWYKLWGGVEEDRVFDIHINGEDIYLTGTSASFSESGQFEAFLLKANLDVLSANEGPQINDVSFSISPNPVFDELYLHGLQTPGLKIQIVDIFGKVYHHSSEVVINVEHLSPGVYFVVTLDNNFQTTQSFVKH